MEFTKVVEKPDSFNAIQYDGTADSELAKWCNGYLKPNKDKDVDGEWTLHLYASPEPVVVDSGDWLVEDAFGRVRAYSNAVYQERFVEASK